jgi:hypothetical protein
MLSHKVTSVGPMTRAAAEYSIWRATPVWTPVRESERFGDLLARRPRRLANGAVSARSVDRRGLVSVVKGVWVRCFVLTRKGISGLGQTARVFSLGTR